MANHNLKTLSEVLAILRKRGITKEIRMNEQKQMVLENEEKSYQPQDLCIIKSYRFEGDSSPDDNAVLYVLEDKDDQKAIIIDSYGADSNYSGEDFDNFLREIPTKDREEYDF